jgi:hypothetical protein
VAGEWTERLLVHYEVTEEPPVAGRAPAVADLVRKGFEALSAGQLGPAAQLLEDALEIEPHAPDILATLSAVNRERGLTGTAIALMREAHERDPDYPLGRAGMASILLAQGETEEARTLLAPLLDRTSLSIGEVRALCMAEIDLLLAEGNGDDAYAWLMFWVRVDPRHPMLRTYRDRIRMVVDGPDEEDLTDGFADDGEDEDDEEEFDEDDDLL